ncbi:pentapeptide repeat-containing protein [Clavibacter michiganensis]|uniref:pentapeptide repeat-containing protein n=1 Tax=Clavibacter michiganensis TaxID=28447 RepID=UPI001177CD78|nr:pentapeptide repeat-containing protein [Clavibacter michiganensis]
MRRNSHRVAGEVQTRSTYAWTIGLVVYVSISAAAIYALPDLLVGQPLSPGEIESLTATEKIAASTAARQVILLSAGGLLAAFTLALTQRRDAVARARHEIDRDANWTNRYTEAVKQLGDDKAAVRYGGIYALERIAEDSERDRATIIEVLAAYVREESPRRESDASVLAEFPASTSVAALRTISRLSNIKGSIQTQLLLSITNLRGASMTDASLGNANFSNSRLDGADMTNAALEGANFDEAILTVAIFTRARLMKTQFRSSVLKYAEFVGANVEYADFTNADASHARFESARATSVKFSGANLSQAALSGADLTGAKFIGSNLEAADAQYARIIQGDFRGANLRGAQFQGAILRDCDLRDITTEETDFSGADFRGARFNCTRDELGYAPGAKFDDSFI